MKVFELIDQLVFGGEEKRPYRVNRVKREIMEGILCGAQGNVHLNDELARVNSEMLVTNDTWIIFSKACKTPARILVVDPITKNIACHSFQHQMPESELARS